MWDASHRSKRAKSATAPGRFRVDSPICKALHFVRSFRWRRGVNNGDRSSAHRIVYAGLYRAILQFGIVIAAAWLFAAFSYYLSRKTGADWFSRSGALMGLVGAAVTFRLAHFYQRALATAL